MKLYISAIKFFFIGALFIISNNNLHITNPVELYIFIDMFYFWIGSILTHIVQITGFVVNSEWLPGNASTPILELGSP